MRLLETWLVLAFIPALAVLLVPAARAIPALRVGALLPLMIMLIHFITEGYRWQLLPAYVVAGLLGGVIVWSYLPGVAPVRLPQWLAWLGSLLLIVTVLLSAGLAWLLPVFEFPAPSGAYAVGTRSLIWHDSRRAGRAVPVQLWYPAVAGTGTTRAPYVDDTRALSAAFQLPSFAFQHLRRVRMGAVEHASLAPDQPTFPVLLFSHGVNGVLTQNTFQFEELASHGYIVVSIDHRFRFADYAIDPRMLQDGTMAALQRFERLWEERVLPDQVANTQFVVDELERLHTHDPAGFLTGRLDLTRLGVFGHSAGGMAGAEFCRADTRCRALLSLDGQAPTLVQQQGLPQPYMFIGQDLDITMSDEELAARGFQPIIRDLARHMLTGIDAAVTHSRGPTYRLRLRHSSHLTFTDFPLLLPVAVGPLAPLVGSIEGGRAHQLINTYTLAFFNHHLRDQPAAVLDEPSTLYPEMQWIPTPQVGPVSAQP